MPVGGGLLSSLSDKLGELFTFARKGLVLSPLNTDPGDGRGVPNGLVCPLRDKSDKSDLLESRTINLKWITIVNISFKSQSIKQ